ncbi:hypothetical protein D3C75_500250 [compost metagenome]
MERFFAGEQPGEDHTVNGPQILQRILYRRSGKGEPVAGLQYFYRLSSLGGMVLDHLRLIENQRVERQPRITLNIPPQQRIRGDNDVSVRTAAYRFAALTQITVSDNRLDLRCEPLQLIPPVVQQRSRRDDQGRLAPLADIRQLREQEGDAMQCFAESHIVSQNASEAVVGQRLHPLEPELLIVTKHGGKAVRQREIEILGTGHIGHQPPEGAPDGNGIAMLSIRIELQALN